MWSNFNNGEQDSDEPEAKEEPTAFGFAAAWANPDAEPEAEGFDEFQAAESDVPQWAANAWGGATEPSETIENTDAQNSNINSPKEAQSEGDDGFGEEVSAPPISDEPPKDEFEESKEASEHQSENSNKQNQPGTSQHGASEASLEIGDGGNEDWEEFNDKELPQVESIHSGNNQSTPDTGKGGASSNSSEKLEQPAPNSAPEIHEDYIVAQHSGNSEEKEDHLGEMAEEAKQTVSFENNKYHQPKEQTQQEWDGGFSQEEDEEGLAQKELERALALSPVQNEIEESKEQNGIPAMQEEATDMHISQTQEQAASLDVEDGISAKSKEENQNDWANGFQNEREQVEEQKSQEEEVVQYETFNPIPHVEDGFDDFENAPAGQNIIADVLQNSDQEEAQGEGWGNAWGEQIEDEDNKEDGFAEFEDAPASNPTAWSNFAAKEPETQEELNDEGFDSFDEGHQKTPSDKQDDDDGFEDFDETQPNEVQTAEVMNPSYIAQSASPINTGESKRNANKINTIFDIYNTREDLEQKLCPFKGPANRVPSQPFNLPSQEPSASLSDFTFMKNRDSMKIFAKQAILSSDYLDMDNEFRDNNNGKTIKLLTLKDLKISTKQDNKSQQYNDPTLKFSIGSKDKKAADLLLGMQFSEAQDTMQAFERKIQSVKMDDELNLFKRRIAQQFKIQLQSPAKVANKQLPTQHSGKQEKGQSPSKMVIARPQFERQEIEKERKPEIIDDQDFDDLESNPHLREQATSHGKGSYYFEQMASEERKQEDSSFGGEQVTAMHKEVEKTDFVKDTFAKFGLSMNLYSETALNINAGSAHDSKTALDQVDGPTQVKLRWQEVMKGLPDYGFLLEQRVSIPKAFYVE